MGWCSLEKVAKLHSCGSIIRVVQSEVSCGNTLGTWLEQDYDPELFAPGKILEKQANG
jgi:hypothetical protein